MCKVKLNSDHVQWHWCDGDAPPEFYYEASRLPLCKTITITSLFCGQLLHCLSSWLLLYATNSKVLLFVRNNYASLSAQWLNFILIWIELQFLYSAHLQLK